MVESPGEALAYLNPLMRDGKLVTDVNAISPGDIVVLEHKDKDLTVKTRAYAVWIYTEEGQKGNGGIPWIIYGSGNVDDDFPANYWTVLAIDSSTGRQG